MGLLATNAQQAAATLGPATPPRAPAAGTLAAAVADSGPGARPEDARGSGGEGSDAGPRAANSTAAPPAAAGGPEQAGTAQPAIVASMSSNMRLASTGKPKGCCAGMEGQPPPAALMSTSQDLGPILGIPSNVHE